jgi:seryl-tRNA synthetase
MTEWQKLMLFVPNIPDPSAPVGKSDADNVVIDTWGDKTKFDFEPKDHIEIMTQLGMVDFERGAKVHGFRGYFLTGDGVRLCFAIWNYAMDFWNTKGFNPVIPPINTRREALLGCGFIPQGEEDIYKAQDGNYFVGTSEVPLRCAIMFCNLELCYGFLERQRIQSNPSTNQYTTRSVAWLWIYSSR